MDLKSFLPIGGKAYAFPRSSWFRSSHYSNMWIREPVVKTKLSLCADLIIFQSTVSPDDRDQTDLISNVTGDRGEAMAGGLWGVAAAR